MKRNQDPINRFMKLSRDVKALPLNSNKQENLSMDIERDKIKKPLTRTKNTNEAFTRDMKREGKRMMMRREREFSFPRLVVIFVLLSSRPRNLLSYLVFFTPTKRYQEVDGVRKEKERLTTDHHLMIIY